MKTLALIFALSLTFGAFASEDLALSECTKGDDGARSVVKTASSSTGDVSISTGTSQN